MHGRKHFDAGLQYLQTVTCGLSLLSHCMLSTMLGHTEERPTPASRISGNVQSKSRDRLREMAKTGQTKAQTAMGTHSGRDRPLK